MEFDPEERTEPRIYYQTLQGLFNDSKDQGQDNKHSFELKTPFPCAKVHVEFRVFGTTKWTLSEDVATTTVDWGVGYAYAVANVNKLDSVTYVECNSSFLGDLHDGVLAGGIVDQNATRRTFVLGSPQTFHQTYDFFFKERTSSEIAPAVSLPYLNQGAFMISLGFEEA